MSLIAGAIVDRSNRKIMLMISDLVSGVITIAVLILFTIGRLELWHLFEGNAITRKFQTLN